MVKRLYLSLEPKNEVDIVNLAIITSSLSKALQRNPFVLRTPHYLYFIKKPLFKNYIQVYSYVLRRVREKVVEQPSLANTLLETLSSNGNLVESLLALSRKLKIKVHTRVTTLPVNCIKKVRYVRRSRKNKARILNEYRVGPYSVRVVDQGSYEKMYRAATLARDSLDLLLASELARLMFIHDLRHFSEYVVKMTLGELLEHRERLGMRLVTFVFFEDEIRDRLDFLARNMISYSTFKSVRLSRVMPFLLDSKVQEFFCDSPGSVVYLDHEDHGRCISNIRLSRLSLNAFLNHLQADTGVPVDEEHSSIKTDYITPYFSIRVAIDRHPLAVDGMVLDVRKHHKKFFSINELIKKKFLPPEAAAYLVTAALGKANIIIAGEPGSGKTTLLNALDAVLPRFIRRIYVEDVVESIRQLDEGVHQVRLKVDPLEVGEVLGLARSSKSVEIVKALHRKPDYVILGELQTREHFMAAFHAMSSGLSCMATCHSRGVNELQLRLTRVYDIPAELLNLLDVLVFTSRNIYANDYKYVSSITEVHEGMFHEVYNYGESFKSQRKVGNLLRRLKLDYDNIYSRLFELAEKQSLTRERVELVVLRRAS